MTTLEIISPWLNGFRSVVLKIAEFIGHGLQADVNTVNNILIGLVAFYIGRKVWAIFYSTTEEREIGFIILVVVLFWVLKYIGA